MSWDRDDVIRFLNAYPLPKDFEWGGQIVQPRYVVEGFGKWLFESGPYYPALRGLPQLITEIIQEIVTRGDPLPTPEELAALLNIEAAKLGPLFRQALRDNPDETQWKPGDIPAPTQPDASQQPNTLSDPPSS